MPIKIKICGIRTKTEALASAKCGADFLGFNFVPTSKRLISLERARKIINTLPKSNRPITVGVFMDQGVKEIKTVISKTKIAMLQFHGNESPKFCQKFGLPYIKAFGVDKQTSVASLAKQMAKYKSDYFMLDRKDRGKGAVIDLKIVKQLAKRFPIILAGGLNPQNVKSAVSKAGKIVGVDVAGGVETNNKRSLRKISAFIKAVK